MRFALIAGAAAYAALAFSAPASAVGPDTVARIDRSLWPVPLQGEAGFDRASRAEILVAISALHDFTEADETSLIATLHVKQADTASVRKVASKFSAILVKNYQLAAAACSTGEWPCPKAGSETELLAAGRALSTGMPANFQPWFDAATRFHQVYMAEVMRLAAVFPRVSSEIDTYSDVERTGFELSDRHFMLTFDDGPTAKDGQTDQLLSVLHGNGIHSAFFLLGERLEQRLKQTSPATLGALYEGQCAGDHGWQHQSHQRWAEWQSSVVNTRDLVKESLPDTYRPWFRPPYGQRLSDSGAFFSQNGLRVILWNIDSQDWNSGVSAMEVAQRVQSLMLLWRHGVVLMHDIHPKAKVAVPWLLDQNKADGVVWEDCRTY